jgi:hypothetical protein
MWRARKSTQTAGRAALLSALLIGAGTGSSMAADIGADCCADLEERVAELEATTARKGNRKVSLEVSGHINEGILFWDDGAESDAYVVTNDNSRTRFRFKGAAKVNKEWELGYLLEVGVRSANSKRVNQLDPRGGAPLPDGSHNPDDVGFDIRDSYWFAKSKTLGTGYLGNSNAATDRITESNLTQTYYFAKYSDVEDTGLGMILRSAVNGRLTMSRLTWRRLIGDSGDQPGEGERGFQLAKYESPKWEGFKASASWGADDFWDVALRYETKTHGFELEAGIGFLELLDGSISSTVCAAATAIPSPAPGSDFSDTACHQYGGSLAILHEPTGLFFNFGTGLKVDDKIYDTVRFRGTDVDDGQIFYAGQAGIEKKFIDLGKTTIYGEHYQYDGGGATRRTVGPGDALNPTGVGSWAVWHSGVNIVGAGIAQGFDDAATIVYLSYRHVEGELQLRQLVGANASGVVRDAPIDDLEVALTGAIIKF